jgi:cation diffusion facilitator family transporter
MEKPLNGNDRNSSVQKVLVRVLIANLAVTILKITIGILTGVLAVVADGFHSLVDSSSNLIGLAAIRLAGRPADERHPYGYQRYETLGALSIGVLMLVAAWEIASAIVERYLGGGEPEVNLISFGLVMLTFPVNLLVVVLEKRSGQRLQSDILLADARHTQTDLYVTGSVLLSLVGIYLGWKWLDLVVATVVVVLIVRSAFDILRDASLWLTDRVVVDEEEVADVTYSVPGVLFVHRIRSRGTPESAFVDLHVKVSPGMSTSRAHAIASEVERRLIAEIEPVREALVHIEPVKKEQPSLWDRMSEDLRRIAEGFGLGLHDLHIHTDVQLGYVVEVHLEFSDQVTLRQAHDLAEEFENQVKRHWPDIEEMITHLEPVPKKVLELESNASVSVERKIYQVLGNFIPIDQVKSLHLYQTGDHLHANLVLNLPGEMKLTQAHEIAEQIELGLRVQPSGVSHVIVHLEPSDNGR